MIQVGGYYSTWDGGIVGPMLWSPHEGGFFYADNTRRPEHIVETYTVDGKILAGQSSPEDIAAVWAPKFV